MKKIFAGVIFLIAGIQHLAIAALPGNFVYLKDIDPSILQEIRYQGHHNFMGRPIAGYQSAECILTKPAAIALHNIQKKLLPHYSLKVYDCYRPTTAVHDFENWSKDFSKRKMQKEFYPRVSKSKLFEQGYIADYSGHSRGSTVDLTIVDLKHPEQEKYQVGQPLVPCYASYGKRFFDNSIDMGTGFDCLDPSAHFNSSKISRSAAHNRQYLRNIMEEAGFNPYHFEWWHFTLKKEPYPHKYFDFPVH